MLGVTCWAGWIWCCKGDESGDPLDRDDRSETDEWIECSWYAVSIDYLKNGACRLIDGVRPTNIVFCEQVGAELQVIVQVKGATSLKAQTESSHSGSLGQLPHALDAAELALSILRGDPRSPPATAVVVAGLQVSIDSMALLVVMLLLVVLLVVSVEVCRGHGCWEILCLFG